MDVAQASSPTLLFGYAAKDTDVSTIDKSHTGNASDLFTPITVPSTQRAIVTPKVGKALNMSLQTIPVRDPVPGEIVLRILYSGICCSVSTNDGRTIFLCYTDPRAGFLIFYRATTRLPQT
jgi:propanol-preferring alcohol dehydrogenase